MDVTSGIQATYADEIEIVECRHEQLAIAMADGYAQTTGDVAVAVVGHGPAIADSSTRPVTPRPLPSSIIYIDINAFADRR